VRDGKRRRFWHDVWIGSVPLKMTFPKLFLAVVNPEASVAMNYDLNSHSWDIHFKGAFGREEMRSWEHLLQLLEPIFLSDQKDRVKWAFEKNGSTLLSLCIGFHLGKFLIRNLKRIGG
jgi:hypothetical protein